MAKKTFVFDLEWAEVLKEYRPEVRHEVYDAIIEYASSGTLSAELKPLAAMAFSFIRRQMDYNRERYESETEKRREAGRKGGLARQRGQTEEAQSSDSNESVEQCQAVLSNAKECQAVPSNAKECQANQADIDIVYDNDIDKYLTLSLGVGGENEILVRKAYMDVFFGSPDLEKFLKRWETTPEELREMCETVLDEWTIFNEVHPTAERARKHFVSAVRLRYQDKIEKQKNPTSRTRRPSGKVHTGTAEKTPPASPAESDTERLDRQQKERDAAFEEMKSKAVKPDEYIRRLGYDPAKVSMLKVMDPEWRAKNPPTLPPTTPQPTTQQPTTP